ncbi:MAG: hypothetical protein WD871_01895 [Xanthobacteraceae bacterium]
MFANLSPELRGYIAELQHQVQFLSDRCAQLSSAYYGARQEAALLKGELDGLRKEAEGAKPNGAGQPGADITS